MTLRARLLTFVLGAGVAVSGAPASAQIEHESPAIEAALKATLVTCSLYVGAVELGTDLPRPGLPYRPGSGNLDYLGDFEDGSVGIAFDGTEPSCLVVLAPSPQIENADELIGDFLQENGFTDPNESDDIAFFFRVDEESQKVPGLAILRSEESGVISLSYSERDLETVIAEAAAREEPASKPSSGEGTPQKGFSAALNATLHFCPAYVVHGDEALQKVDPQSKYGLRPGSKKEGQHVWSTVFADATTTLVTINEPRQCLIGLDGEAYGEFAKLIMSLLAQSKFTATGSGENQGTKFSAFEGAIDGEAMAFTIAQDTGGKESMVFVKRPDAD